jgi:heavy metal translocating P-type ATPase
MPATRPDQAAHSDAQQEILMIDGMHCSSCAIAVETALAKQPGVSQARVNFAADVAVISWHGEPPDFLLLQRCVARLGYQLHRNSNRQQRQQQADNTRKHLQMRLVVAVFFGMWSMMPTLLIYLSPSATTAAHTLWLLALASGLFAIPVIVYSGSHFYRVGWRTLRAGAPGLDSLISLAVVCATGLSVWQLYLKSPHVYFDTAVMLITFQLIARLLDTHVRRRATEVIHRLLHELPSSVNSTDGQGASATKNIQQVLAGEHIVVTAGQTLALDGVIAQGTALVDKAMLSGEHTPQAISVGDTLMAGCTIIEGELTLRVTHTVGQRRIDALAHSISVLLGQKTSLQRLTDRMARALLPVALLAALGAIGLALNSGLGYPQVAARALAVLIITCPCALSLAIPLVIAMSYSRMLESGIVLREPSVLETAANVGVVVFDKTGTLTTHQPSVQHIAPEPGFSPPQLLQLAQNILYESSHPIALGVLNDTTATADAGHLGTRRSVIGQGTQWQHGRNIALAGKAQWLAQQGIPTPPLSTAPMHLHIALNNRYAGHITFTETLQPGAKALLTTLRQRGLLTYLLSGDTTAACQVVAERLSFAPQQVHANQLPEDKHRFIQTLQQQHTVAFVGDGMNDGLALAGATLGVSVGRANTITSMACAIYLSGSLPQLELTLHIAQRARRLMRQNLGWAIGYNLLIIPTAMMGWIQPVIAAAAMSISSLCVLLNSVRMRSRP